MVPIENSVKTMVSKCNGIGSCYLIMYEIRGRIGKTRLIDEFSKDKRTFRLVSLEELVKGLGSPFQSI